MPAESLELAWQRVVGWLEVNAPVTASELHDPVSLEEIDATQQSMGIVFPEELRYWLGFTGMDSGRKNMMEGVLPGIGDLLGLVRIKQIYLLKMEIENEDPSDPDDAPFWQESWIPICADSDALYGKFLDADTGQVGSFEDSGAPSFGVYDSLAALFSETADSMESIFSDASDATGAVHNGRLMWN